MSKQRVRSILRKSAFFAAAVVAITPAIGAQNARTVLPGTAAYDALPAAVSPAVASAASAKAVSYSTQTFSTVHIPDASSTRPVRQIAVESLPSRRNWLILSVASHSAATFDAYSTRRSIAAGNVEANPLMRPFANSPAIYAAIQASPLVMDFAAFKMQRSNNRFVRRLWWMPQATGTAMSLFAGAHNMSIVRH